MVVVPVVLQLPGFDGPGPEGWEMTGGTIGEAIVIGMAQLHVPENCDVTLEHGADVGLQLYSSIGPPVALSVPAPDA